MDKLNYFGGFGYLTPEERKKTLQYGCRHFKFYSVIDLSIPVRVVPIDNRKEFTITEYTKDVAIFIGWWASQIMPGISGFPGFGGISFDCSAFKIVNK